MGENRLHFRNIQISPYYGVGELMILREDNLTEIQFKLDADNEIFSDDFRFYQIDKLIICSSHTKYFENNFKSRIDQITEKQQIMEDLKFILNHLDLTHHSEAIEIINNLLFLAESNFQYSG
jgi:hypothetical protein